MKIAFCISGQMRTLNRCVESMQRHLFSRYDHDIFIHAEDDGDAWMTTLLEARTVVKVVRPEFDEKNYIHRSGRGIGDVQGFLKMVWSIEQANVLRKAAEVERGVRYDWVFRLRTDTQFHEDIEDLAMLDPSAVYVPTYCNFFGCNDQFAFGGPEAMDVYSDKFELLDEYVAGGGIVHPESFLKWALERGCVPTRRTMVIYDILRKNGERVRPSWVREYGDIIPVWKEPFLAK